MSNDLGTLARGNKYGVKAIDTIDFIIKNEVSTTSKVTYENLHVIIELSKQNSKE